MKKILAFFLAAAMVTASAACAFAYLDVGTDYDWAQEAISYLTEQNQLHGYPDGTFRPAQNITRAELCKLAVAQFGAKAPVSYQDVQEEDWYYPYVSQSGGYFLSESQFYPNRYATREEVAYAIFFGMGATDDRKDKSVSFPDEDAIDSRYLGAVKQLQQNGIITGYPDGSFGPKHNITRAEVCVMLYRVAKAQTQLPVLPTPSEAPQASTHALNHFFLVTEVSSVLNADGEVATRVKGWNQGYEETLLIDDGITIQGSSLVNRSKIEKNDVLAFTRDIFDRIRTVQIVMNLSAIPAAQSVISVNTQNSKRRIITGRVKTMYQAKAIDILDVDGVTVWEYLLEKEVHVYLLNKNAKLQLSDIYEINDSRYEAGDRILAYCNGDVISEIVIIKE